MMMGPTLQPLLTAAMLFFNFMAYRYGVGVGERCHIDPLPALLLGLLCVILANLMAVLIGIGASQFRK